MVTQNTHLLSFLNDLRQAKIHYRLGQHRENAIMVEIAVSGERWEVEFLDEGGVEAEVFRSDGTIHDAGVLEQLVSKHSN